MAQREGSLLGNVSDSIIKAMEPREGYGRGTKIAGALVAGGAAAVVALVRAPVAISQWSAVRDRVDNPRVRAAQAVELAKQRLRQRQLNARNWRTYADDPFLMRSPADSFAGTPRLRIAQRIALRLGADNRPLVRECRPDEAERVFTDYYGVGLYDQRGRPILGSNPTAQAAYREAVRLYLTMKVDEAVKIDPRLVDPVSGPAFIEASMREARAYRYAGLEYPTIGRAPFEGELTLGVRRVIETKRVLRHINIEVARVERSGSQLPEFWQKMNPEKRRKQSLLLAAHLATALISDDYGTGAIGEVVVATAFGAAAAPYSIENGRGGRHDIDDTEGYKSGRAVLNALMARLGIVVTTSKPVEQDLEKIPGLKLNVRAYNAKALEAAIDPANRRRPFVPKLHDTLPDEITIIHWLNPEPYELGYSFLGPPLRVLRRGGTAWAEERHERLIRAAQENSKGSPDNRPSEGAGEQLKRVVDIGRTAHILAAGEMMLDEWFGTERHVPVRVDTKPVPGQYCVRVQTPGLSPELAHVMYVQRVIPSIRQQLEALRHGARAGTTGGDLNGLLAQSLLAMTGDVDLLPRGVRRSGGKAELLIGRPGRSSEVSLGSDDSLSNVRVSLDRLDDATQRLVSQLRSEGVTGVSRQSAAGIASIDAQLEKIASLFANLGHASVASGVRDAMGVAKTRPGVLPYGIGNKAESGVLVRKDEPAELSVPRPIESGTEFVDPSGRRWAYLERRRIGSPQTLDDLVLAYIDVVRGVVSDRSIDLAMRAGASKELAESFSKASRLKRTEMVLDHGLSKLTELATLHEALREERNSGSGQRLVATFIDSDEPLEDLDFAEQISVARAGAAEIKSDIVTATNLPADSLQFYARIYAKFLDSGQDFAARGASAYDPMRSFAEGALTIVHTTDKVGDGMVALVEDDALEAALLVAGDELVALGSTPLTAVGLARDGFNGVLRSTGRGIDTALARDLRLLGLPWRVRPVGELNLSEATTRGSGQQTLTRVLGTYGNVLNISAAAQGLDALERQQVTRGLLQLGAQAVTTSSLDMDGPLGLIAVAAGLRDPTREAAVYRDGTPLAGQGATPYEIHTSMLDPLSARSSWLTRRGPESHRNPVRRIPPPETGEFSYLPAPPDTGVRWVSSVDLRRGRLPMSLLLGHDGDDGLGTAFPGREGSFWVGQFKHDGPRDPNAAALQDPSAYYVLSSWRGATKVDRLYPPGDGSLRDPNPFTIDDLLAAAVFDEAGGVDFPSVVELERERVAAAMATEQRIADLTDALLPQIARGIREVTDGAGLTESRMQDPAYVRAIAGQVATARLQLEEARKSGEPDAVRRGVEAIGEIAHHVLASAAEESNMIDPVELDDDARQKLIERADAMTAAAAAAFDPSTMDIEAAVDVSAVRGVEGVRGVPGVVARRLTSRFRRRIGPDGEKPLLELGERGTRRVPDAVVPDPELAATIFGAPEALFDSRPEAPRSAPEPTLVLPPSSSESADPVAPVPPSLENTSSQLWSTPAAPDALRETVDTAPGPQELLDLIGELIRERGVRPPDASGLVVHDPYASPDADGDGPGEGRSLEGPGLH